jgi:predicted site-specific integrase-resolvase
LSAREFDALLRSRTAGAERWAVYAGVSSEKQAEAGKLPRQKERLVYEVVVVGAERASGLNEKRRGLQRLFRLAAAGEIDVGLVEFRERQARFGFGAIMEAFQAHGVRVEVLVGPGALAVAQESVVT